MTGFDSVGSRPCSQLSRWGTTPFMHRPEEPRLQDMHVCGLWIRREWSVGVGVRLQGRVVPDDGGRAPATSR
jgi:hypothetical protein